MFTRTPTVRGRLAVAAVALSAALAAPAAVGAQSLGARATARREGDR